MRSLVDIAALPAMLAWVAHIRGNTLALPRPRGDPRVHSPGTDPDRILVIGGGAAVGWGALNYDLSLAGVLARGISAHTDRGVDAEIIARAGMTAKSAIARVEGLKLWRYDAVVTCLGLNESIGLVSIEDWRRNCEALLDLVLRGASAATEVFVLGVPPMSTLPVGPGPMRARAQKHANKLDRATAEICERRPRVSFFELKSDDLPSLGDVPARAEYEAWGVDLGERMAPLLQRDRVEEARDSRFKAGFDNESDRQAAVQAVAQTLGGARGSLDRVVRLAADLFDTEIAVFTMLDGDTQRHVARVGLQGSEGPRATSFCTHTIQQRGGMIVPDACRMSDSPSIRT